MSELKTLAINGKKYTIVDDKAQSGIKTLTDNITTLATKTELEEKISALDLTNFATKTEVADKVTNEELAAKGYLTAESLTGYATKTDLNDKVTKNELAAKNYITEDNLTAYAKTTALEAKADKTQLTNYVTTTVLEGKGYLTSHQDISGKLDTAEVANEANKIPRFNAEGHLVLPDGTELW